MVIVPDIIITCNTKFIVLSYRNAMVLNSAQLQSNIIGRKLPYYMYICIISLFLSLSLCLSFIPGEKTKKAHYQCALRQQCKVKEGIFRRKTNEICLFVCSPRYNK